jgi:hypothetical protein
MSSGAIAMCAMVQQLNFQGCNRNIAMTEEMSISGAATLKGAQA